MNTELKDTKAFKRNTVFCLLNEEISAYPGSIAIILDYWKNAKSEQDFANSVLADDRLRFNQGYAELSKECDDHWERVLEMLKRCKEDGDKTYETMSDIGGVRVGNEFFSCVINNGVGDGSNYVAIIEKSKINEHMMRLSDSVLDGEFNIYSYDCGGYKLCTLNGKYFVYEYEGLMAFVKYE